MNPWVTSSTVADMAGRITRSRTTARTCQLRALGTIISTIGANRTHQEINTVCFVRQLREPGPCLLRTTRFRERIVLCRNDVRWIQVSTRSTPERPVRPRRYVEVLQIASEALPFSKTGGLADVTAALSLALERLGHRVTLVMPRYRCVAVSGAPVREGAVVLGGRRFDVTYFEHPLGERARAILVECPELYDRDGLYGIGNRDYPDNPIRFAVLVRAALEFVASRGERPAVIHAHDWQGGLAPVYLKTRYAGHPVLGGVPSVFTIHNAAYQGLCPADSLSALDLSGDLHRIDALEYWGQISLLKGGINFSDMITTVSRKYARELLTPEFGFGFEGIIARRRGNLVGIPNGIDVDVWNPESDPHLPEPFSADRLSSKRVSKRELLRAYALPSDVGALARPVVGMISRLVAQKGFDLLSELATELPGLNCIFVVLGTGESRYEEFWHQLATRYPRKVGVRITRDEKLAHLIEAGADMFLMPSHFEPCGLNQMYSMRYGTVPVVRATGGLDDTVQNYSERTGRGTGFKFENYNSDALLKTLKRALHVYTQKSQWRAIQRSGMSRDFSWDVSAREYVRVYRRAARAVSAVPGSAKTIPEQLDVEPDGTSELR